MPYSWNWWFDQKQKGNNERNEGKGDKIIFKHVFINPLNDENIKQKETICMRARMAVRFGTGAAKNFEEKLRMIDYILIIIIASLQLY